jgi:hypothetical protein
VKRMTAWKNDSGSNTASLAINIFNIFSHFQNYSLVILLFLQKQYMAL